MLSITTKGTDELTRNFRQMEKKVKNHKVLYKRIGIKLVKWIDDNFKAEGIEEKWAGLKPRTIARRRKGSSKILQDTGGLRASYDYKVGSRSVKIGSGKDYAKHHEFGTKYIPKRPMLPSKPLALTIAIDVTQKFVAEGIK